MKWWRLAVLASVLFFCTGCIADTYSDDPVFTALSSLFILVLALPAYYSVVRWLGVQRGVTTLGLIGTLVVLIEVIAAQTGLPYGEFRYSAALGYSVLGVVPWSVGFAYLPILLGSHALASRYIKRGGLALCGTTALFNLAMDLVVDPAAVHLGLWRWSYGGSYYGVPLINFLGWLLTGFGYSGVVLRLTAGRTSMPIETLISSFLILSFWTGYAMWNGLDLPALLGAVLLGGVVWVLRGAHRPPPGSPTFFGIHL